MHGKKIKQYQLRLRSGASLLKASLGRKKARPYLKNTQHTHKKAGGVPQVVQCLPGKCENLSSNPSATK
jgi:hypothetical protein